MMYLICVCIHNFKNENALQRCGIDFSLVFYSKFSYTCYSLTWITFQLVASSA